MKASDIKELWKIKMVEDSTLRDWIQILQHEQDRRLDGLTEYLKEVLLCQRKK